jgi:hypothetical protein
MHACRPLIPAALAVAAMGAGITACATPAAHPAARTTAVSDPLARLSAGQIADLALGDLKNAATVRVRGNFGFSGQLLTLQLTLVRGRGCSGSIAMQREGSLRMIVVGKKVWFKPDKEFYSSAAGPGSLPAVLAGKYLQVDDGTAMGSLAQICVARQLAGLFGTDMAGLVKGAETTIGGQPALAIKDTGDAAAIYVTIAARPEILRISNPGASGGSLDFSGYDVPATVTPPPSGEVLNGSEFGS